MKLKRLTGSLVSYETVQEGQRDSSTMFLFLPLLLWLWFYFFCCCFNSICSSSSDSKLTDSGSGGLYEQELKYF